MKEDILKLREEGKTYDEIASVLKCSKGLISYHCNPQTKEKTRKRQQELRKNSFCIKGQSFRQRKLSKNKTEKFQIRSKDGRSTFSAKLKTFTWQSALEKLKQNPFCYLTGESLDLENFSNVTFDHILPVSQGGDNSIENLGFCTPLVNKSKTSMTPEEYVDLCKKVLIHHGYTITKGG